jgi:hypothetical protein
VGRPTARRRDAAVKIIVLAPLAAVLEMRCLDKDNATKND